jgi:hypothetical protein
MNVLTKVVTSPFAVLSSVFGGKGEEIRYQDFAPGSFELRPPEIDKLNALVKGLYERPGLQLEIQGSVDPDLDREALRRLALDKQVRLEQWQSLRKSAREETPPDRIVVTPEERSDLIAQLYSEALAKGRITAAAVNAQAPPPAPANPPATPVAKPMKAPLRPGPELKGAASLLWTSSPPMMPLAASASTTGTTAAAPAVNIERALLDSIPINDSDFETLASERAKSVRAYVLSTGKVEPERVFLADTASSGVKTEGARAYLQLR